MSPPWTPERFEDLFRTSAPRVRRFISRHVDPDAVDDVLSETFTVAWQRLEHVPDPALPWLLVVARNMCRRHWRTRRQSEARWLAAVEVQWHDPAPAPDVEVLRRDQALLALSACSNLEREALLLTAWDGLSHRDAAAVAGCSPRAFAVRLSRARARFDRASLRTESSASTSTGRGIRSTTAQEPS